MKLLLVTLGLACVLQLTLATVAKHCPDRCGYASCGKGKKCVWNKEKCKADCVCSITCKTVRCGWGARCVDDPKTCKFKCVCPTVCTKELNPVCGTDGVTYNNPCLLGIATCKSNGETTKRSDGKCPCKSKCPVTFCGPRKYCDWDKRACKTTCPCRRTCKTYHCKNKARCIQNKKTCRRRCVCSRACPRIYRPVCGSNGQTYSNQCLLNYATCKSKGKITKKSHGRCPCKITCANVKCKNGARCVHNPRNCKTQCVCSKACSKIYRPVCGSDGVTYSNQCLLNYAMCKSKGKIQKKKNGKCCSVDCTTAKCSKGRRCVHDPIKCITKCVCNNICTLIYKPVCGSDGKTYGNECQLNSVICKSNGKITKKSDGRCPKVCPHHNPCAGVRCGYGKRCVPNFSRCAYSCQPRVCPHRQCVQAACDARPCKKGQRCIEICKNSCVHACEISRYRHH